MNIINVIAPSQQSVDLKSVIGKEVSENHYLS